MPSLKKVIVIRRAAIYVRQRTGRVFVRTETSADDSPILLFVKLLSEVDPLSETGLFKVTSDDEP